jgi:hypothetical protein
MTETKLHCTFKNYFYCNLQQIFGNEQRPFDQVFGSSEVSPAFVSIALAGSQG